ncbi:MAG: hypothetical protein U5J62_08810 [Desulfurivibrio sp.]|nr:hypothetical protein [Desulfurivibrio sp.]
MGWLFYWLRLSVAHPSPAKATAIIDDLKANSIFTMEGFGTFYPRDAKDDDGGSNDREIDDSDGQLWSMLTLASRAFVGSSMSLEFEAYLGWTTHDDEFAGYFHHPDYDKHDRPPRGDIKLFNIKQEGVNYTLTVGKTMLDVGLAEIFSPTDRFNLVNASYPQHPQNYGTWLARLAWYLGQDTLSFIVTPYEEHGWMPHPSSRWYGDGDPDFYKIAIPPGFAVQDADSVHNTGYMALYEGMREGLLIFFFLLTTAPPCTRLYEDRLGPRTQKNTPWP